MFSLSFATITALITSKKTLIDFFLLMQLIDL